VGLVREGLLRADQVRIERKVFGHILILQFLVFGGKNCPRILDKLYRRI
jgi:hypothetical protein